MLHTIGATKYKCFEDTVIFNSLKRVNVLIGKNNSGKSSAVDLIEYLTNKENSNSESDSPVTFFETNITQEIIDATQFSDHSPLGKKQKNQFINTNELDITIKKRKKEFSSFLSDLIGSNIKWAYKKQPHIIDERSILNINSLPEEPLKSAFYNDFIKNLTFEIEKKTFKRISAERDIIPEKRGNNNHGHIIKSNGEGLTDAVYAYKNITRLSKNSGYIIKKKLLDAINEVFSKDGHFIDIECKELETKEWEIYLEEEDKTVIPLSESGSGLKTIIIVLCFLILVPEIEKKDLKEYIFGFEELENNLHPALLRRLTSYIHDLSIKEEFIFLLTTHSSVLIDQFSEKEDAQIIHLVQSAGKTECRTIETFLQNTFILDDLEVRASDLLQANGIIWVEGPTDAIYIKKWLEVFTSENMKEEYIQGRDFEFHMFAGTLLDSLSLITSDSNEEEELKKLVSMFSFSRNAYVVIDSDAVTDDNGEIIDKSKFKNAKQYIKAQFEELSSESNNLGLWFKEGDTEVRTIEDYLDNDSKKLIAENPSWTKKVAAQKITNSWNNRKMSDFPHNLTNEIEALYNSIENWNT